MTKPMLIPLALLCTLALAACDTRVPDPGDARMQATPPATAAARDPSVPSAATVQSSPAAPTAADEAGARPTGTLTPAQESSAMPMPGQANNYSSTALDPAARAASAASGAGSR